MSNYHAEMHDVIDIGRIEPGETSKPLHLQQARLWDILDTGGQPVILGISGLSFQKDRVTGAMGDCARPGAITEAIPALG